MTHVVVPCLLMLTLLTACGSSHDSANPASPKSAAVTITVDEGHGLCDIALAAEAQPSRVPCAEVVSFMHDELRTPAGTDVLVRADASDSALLATISANLTTAGYRPTGKH